MDRILDFDAAALRGVLTDKKDEFLRQMGEVWDKLQARDVSVLKPVIHAAESAGKKLKTAKKVKAGIHKAREIREKLPKAEDMKNAVLGVWAKVLALFAALVANFRHPGLSEFAAIGAFVLSIAGTIGSFFSEKLRRLRPLFAALAAIGTVIVILRIIFPRRED